MLGVVVSGIENNAETMSEFQQWFERHYEGSVKVRLAAAGEGMGTGVFAVEPISPESLYLSIPLNIVIGKHTVFPTPVIGPFLTEIERMTPFDKNQIVLSLFLIYERFVRGQESFFAPYIATLPQHFDIPEFFTDSELASLKGTSVPRKARINRQQHEREFKWIKDNIALRHPEVFPAGAMTLHNYLWAVSVLNTRMIWWDGEPHLVPMLDMINCREGPNPRRVHQTTRSGNRANTYAPWAFQVGEQVFENYGQPNTVYYLWHGFVLLPNTHDCAIVPLTPGKVSPQAMRKLEYFRMLREELCVSPTKYEELVAFGRVATAKPKELKLMTNAPVGRVMSNKAERRALKFAAEQLMAALAGFPLYNPEWRTLTNLTSSRSKTIAVFRETQRELLNATINKLRNISRKIPKRSKKVEENRSDEL